MSVQTEQACAACGKPLRPGARFCTSCGTPVAASVVVVQAQPAAAAAGRPGSAGRCGPSRPPPRRSVPPSTASAPRAWASGSSRSSSTPSASRSSAVSCSRSASSAVLAGLAAAELVIGIVVWEARTGRTFGNVLLGLRAARQETPYAPGLARGVPRALVLAAGHLVAGVGQWLVVGSSGFDKSGRGQGVARPRRSVRGRRRPRPARGARARLATTVTSAAPPPPAPTAVVVPTSYLVTLDTGQTMSVSGPGLVGRSPQVVPGERCDHVIAIDDPERSLSRTHARFGIDRGGFWVADAGSGNGTVVVLPSGQSVPAAPEQRVVVPSGSTVRIGDRTFTVRAVAPR